MSFSVQKWTEEFWEWIHIILSHLIRIDSVWIKAHAVNTQILTSACTVIIARGTVWTVPFWSTGTTGKQKKRKIWTNKSHKTLTTPVQTYKWRITCKFRVYSHMWPHSDSPEEFLPTPDTRSHLQHTWDPEETCKCWSESHMNRTKDRRLSEWLTCQLSGQRQWKASNKFKQVPVFWHGLLLQVFRCTVYEIQNIIKLKQNGIT